MCNGGNGKSAKGYKDLSQDEWFLKYWPKILPGMLQIEALVQMSALSILTLPNNKGNVTSANNLKFIKKIIPNNRLYIETIVNSYKRGIANCSGKGL